jgi:hypothetical protein
MKRFFDKDVVKITYISVFIFIIVYVVIQIQPWFKLTTSWHPVALFIAILLAAPLIFSLLWERITSIKAFGVEIGLAEVEQSVSDTPLSDRINTSHPPRSNSDFEEIVIGIIVTVTRANETKVIKINLGQGKRWTVIYLYLLIALLEDESETQQIIFVDDTNGQEERFIGLATPASVRRAIASNFRFVEIVYRNAYVTAMENARRGDNNRNTFEDRVRSILRYFWSLMSDRPQYQEEFNIFEIWVTSRDLATWLQLANNGVKLNRVQIDKLLTDRKFTPSLISTIINRANSDINMSRIDASTRFLAIIQGEKLILIVDLLQLAVITAADATSKG